MSANPDSAPSGESPYDVLGLAPGASEDEIEEAYGDLSKMFAPGAIADSRQQWARRQRARLAAAYAELMDPDRKKALDSRLGVTNAAQPAPETAPEIATADQPTAPEDVATIEETAPVLDADIAEEIAPVAEGSTDQPADVEPDTDAATSEETAPQSPEEYAQSLQRDEETQTLQPEQVETPTVKLAPDTTPTPRVRPSAARRIPQPVSAPEPETSDDEDIEDLTDLEEVEPASFLQPPARFTPSPRQPVTSKPAMTNRSEGGVNLPSRQKAAQITAQQAAQNARPATPAPAPAPTRRAPTPQSPATRPTQPGVVRRSTPTPAGASTTTTPRRTTPPPAAPRKRKKGNSMLPYQILTAVVALVLILGTVAGYIGTTSSTSSAAPTVSAASYVAAGDSALAAGNGNGAVSNYSQALQVDPNNQDAMLGLARYYVSINQLDLARTYITQILNVNSQTQEAQDALGILTDIGASSSPTVAPVLSPETTSAAQTPASVITDTAPLTTSGTVAP